MRTAIVRIVGAFGENQDIGLDTASAIPAFCRRAIEFPKRATQPLISICSALLSAEINIHYAYPFLLGPRGPVLALYVDDPTLATQILIRKGFTLIAESDLKDR